VARDVVARTKCIPPVPPVLEGQGGREGWPRVAQLPSGTSRQIPWKRALDVARRLPSPPPSLSPSVFVFKCTRRNIKGTPAARASRATLLPLLGSDAVSSLRRFDNPRFFRSTFALFNAQSLRLIADHEHAPCRLRDRRRKGWKSGFLVQEICVALLPVVCSFSLLLFFPPAEFN